MYRYSAPVYNSHITKETRKDYLSSFENARISRVFLIAKYSFETGEVYDLALLRENVAWLRACGLSPAIWAGETLGHGGLLHDTGRKDLPKCTPLRNFNGEELAGTRCPTDPRFEAVLCRIFETLASTHPDYILVDDDFRISYRGRVHACVCERHLQLISQRYGAPVTQEEVRESVMHGGANRLRSVYLSVMGDTLRTLARKLRASVDKVDKSVGLSLCTCHNHWDLDGADPVELTKIFAGERAPLLRLHGAPYWAAVSPDKDLPFVFEHARMFAALSAGHGFELMNELDAYPRPRQNCPASYMELTDAVLRADHSTHGALKYMYDYTSSLGYEEGYLRAHERDLSALEQMEHCFSDGEQVGVHVCVAPHLIEQSDSDLTPPHAQMPRPVAGTMLSRCSIPTTYTQNGICRAVFGEAVTTLPDEALCEGLVLDAVSALLLYERGVDVGLTEGQALRELLRHRIPGRVMSADRAESAFVYKAGGKFLLADCKKDARVLLTLLADGEKFPLCYTYENGAGQRFFVWLFHAAQLLRDSDLTKGYLIQEAMMNGIEWVAKKPLPVTCKKNPGLYIMCKKTENTMSVALFNAFADSIFTPTLTLDEAYAEFTAAVNTKGAVQGSTVTLSELPAFSFAAFTVKK